MKNETEIGLGKTKAKVIYQTFKIYESLSIIKIRMKKRIYYEIKY